jgi:hypothetical protein
MKMGLFRCDMILNFGLGNFEIFLNRILIAK